MTDDNNDPNRAKTPFGQRREPPEADLTGSPSKGKRSGRSLLRAVLKWSVVAMLVLVVAGARESNGDPEALAQAFPLGKGVVVPGCDHFSAIPHALTKAATFDFLDGMLDDPFGDRF